MYKNVIVIILLLLSLQPIFAQDLTVPVCSLKQYSYANPYFKIILSGDFVYTIEDKDITVYTGYSGDGSKVDLGIDVIFNGLRTSWDQEGLYIYFILDVTRDDKDLSGCTAVTYFDRDSYIAKNYSFSHQFEEFESCENSGVEFEYIISPKKFNCYSEYREYAKSIFTYKLVVIPDLSTGISNSFEIDPPETVNEFNRDQSDLYWLAPKNTDIQLSWDPWVDQGTNMPIGISYDLFNAETGTTVAVKKSYLRILDIAGNSDKTLFEWGGVVYSDIPESLTFNTGMTPGQNEYLLVLEAEDFFGNRGRDFKECHIYVDDQPPPLPKEISSSQIKEIEIDGIKRNYIIPDTSGSVSFTFDAVTDIEVVKDIPGSGVILASGYIISIDGQPGSGVEFSQTGTIVTAKVPGMSALGTGSHILRVKTRDAYGNTSATAKSFPFWVDGSPGPAPALTVNDSYYTSNTHYLTNMNSVVVNWPAAAGINYRLERKNGSGWTTVNEEDDGSVLVNWGTATEVTIRLVALNSTGTISSAGNEYRLMLLPPVASVTFPVNPFFAEGNELKMKWNPVLTSSGGLYTLKNYRYQIRDAGAPVPALTDTGWVTTTVPQISLKDVEEGVLKRIYVVAVSSLDSGTFTHTGVVPVQGYPVFVAPTEPPVTEVKDEPVVITGTAYWWHNPTYLNGDFTVAEGATLFVEKGCQVIITSGLDIKITILGTLVVLGENGQTVTLTTDDNRTGFDWKGLFIEGTGEIGYCTIERAERGLTIASGGVVTLNSSIIRDNETGIHIHDAMITVMDSIIQDNTLYGVKEDALGITSTRPVFKNNRFTDNGYSDYYHAQERNITIQRLNELSDDNEENL
jgi:hypothetical protein